MAAERKQRQQHAAKRDENIVGIMNMIEALQHQVAIVMGVMSSTSSKLDLMTEQFGMIDEKVDTSLKGLCYLSEMCESMRCRCGMREDIQEENLNELYNIESKSVGR